MCTPRFSATPLEKCDFPGSLPDDPFGGLRGGATGCKTQQIVPLACARSYAKRTNLNLGQDTRANQKRIRLRLLRMP